VKRTSVILAMGLALGLVSATASAQPRRGMDMGWGWGGGGAEGGPMMLHLMLRNAGLNDAQQAQVRQILAAHRPQFRAIRGQIGTLQRQLADALYAPGAVKPEDLTATTQQIAHLRDHLAQEALQTALEVRAVLTPEQLTKVSELRQRMRELRMEMRKLMGGGDGS
jgi:periplasmic protein CpxP/Spy